MILDEPTASLDSNEVEKLFAVVRSLKAKGLAIVFITHFLDQVFELSDRVTVLLEDYRDLTGRYDKLVSIEMIEAVGDEFLDNYFAVCSRLLKPNGLFVLQGITIADQLHAGYVRRVDFIQKYIFPGGCLPSVTRIGESITRSTDLRLFHLEDFAPHYARTLSCWRDRFRERLQEVRALGFDERFIRMWEYYLAYCEAGFLSGNIDVRQVVFAKPR